MKEHVKARNNLAIAGDFSAQTGTAALESNIYKKQIEKCGKEKANNNDYRLQEMAKSQFLKLTNTFLRHKQCHRSTWELSNKVSQIQSIESITVQKPDPLCMHQR